MIPVTANIPFHNNLFSFKPLANEEGFAMPFFHPFKSPKNQLIKEPVPHKIDKTRRKRGYTGSLTGMGNDENNVLEQLTYPQYLPHILHTGNDKF